jgi:hypothetical protein
MEQTTYVENLRLRKQKAEHDIYNIIRQFKQDTGLLITDIDITCIDITSVAAPDGGTGILSHVTVKVEL